jgi:hypothetical protein
MDRRDGLAINLREYRVNFIDFPFPKSVNRRRDRTDAVFQPPMFWLNAAAR